MKNYFGLAMLIWCIAFILALLLAWPVILQNSIQLTSLPIDKRFLISVFSILFDPTSNIFIWIIWLVAGFLGGLLIKGVKSGALLNLFSVGVLYLMFMLLLLQVQSFMSSIFEVFMSLFWFMIVIGLSVIGGSLGGLIRRDGKTKMVLTQANIEVPLTKCPKCGQEFYSNPLFCCFCGAEIRAKKEKM